MVFTEFLLESVLPTRLSTKKNTPGLNRGPSLQYIEISMTISVKDANYDRPISTVYIYTVYHPSLIRLSPHLFISSFSLAPPLLYPTCWTTVGHLAGVPGKYRV